jgi:hypothetical protein
MSSQKVVAICLQRSRELPLVYPRDQATRQGMQFREARFETMRRLSEKGIYPCTVCDSDYVGNGLFSKHFSP